MVLIIWPIRQSQNKEFPMNSMLHPWHDAFMMGLFCACQNCQFGRWPTPASFPTDHWFCL